MLVPTQEMPPELCSPEDLAERRTAAGPPDELLVERANEGDLAAFEAIVARHRPAMVARCRGVLDSHGAEDAVQHAMLNAWNALREGCEVENLRAWLMVIAHRCALQSLRARREPPVLISELQPGGPSPADELDRSLRTRAALSAVAALPDGEREALVSTAIHGRSGREAARALGVSEGMVRQLVHRARVRVREAAGAGLPAVAVPNLLTRLWAQRPGAGRFAHRLGAGSQGDATAQGMRLAGRAALVLAAGALAGGVPAAVHRFEGGHGRAAAPRLAADGSPIGRGAARGPAGARSATVRSSGRTGPRTSPAPSGAVARGSAPTGSVAPGGVAAAATGATSPTVTAGTTGSRAGGGKTPTVTSSAPSAGTVAAPVTAAGGGAVQQVTAPVVGAVGQAAGGVATHVGEAVSQAGGAVERAGETVGRLGGETTKAAGEAVSHTGETVKAVGETVSGVGGSLPGVLNPK